MMPDLESLKEAVLKGDANTSGSIKGEAIKAETEMLTLLNECLVPSMKLTIEAFQAAGLREKVEILIGGAPVTQRFADEIRADGYGENAPAAVALARKCLGPTANGSTPCTSS